MIEVRIHGRGGQGNVVVACLLAIAAFEDKQYGQAFPAFGAERRGAPVTAFVRIADVPPPRSQATGFSHHHAGRHLMRRPVGPLPGRLA